MSRLIYLLPACRSCTRTNQFRFSALVKITVSSLACGPTGSRHKGAGRHSRDVVFILPLGLQDSRPNPNITCHIQSCLTPCYGPASVHNIMSRITAQADVANFTILFSTQGQFWWYSMWAKWHRERFVSDNFCVPVSELFHRSSIFAYVTCDGWTVGPFQTTFPQKYKPTPF